MENIFSRRNFLKAAGLGAATLAADGRSGAWGGTSDRGRTDKPNIVILIADDHSMLDSGCYGNTVVKTPNIDRLAREGMRFTRAFTATAMCAPTRSILYTGLYAIRSGAYPNHSLVYPGTRSLPHYLKKHGYRVALAGKKHIGPVESFPFEYIARTAAAVNGFIRSRDDQPFCLIIATNDPHSPWKKDSSYDPEKIELPPYLVDTPQTRQAVANYYADVSSMDEEVGTYAEVIRKHNLEANTLFIYTSEQGAQFPHGKWTCYDVGLAVEFIARWPGRIQPGSVSDAMIHYVDVAPTLIEIAGGKPIKGLDGRSFLDVLLGKKDEHRSVVYGVHTTRGIIDGSECYPIRSIRTATHKYIMNLNADTSFRNVLITKDKENYWRSWVEKAKTDAKAAKLVDMYQHRPAEELYDLRRDPYELNNIGADPANGELVASLRKRLEDWMKEQGDRGVETEMLAFERQRKKKK
jgi:uncharacterized sulfatase